MQRIMRVVSCGEIQAAGQTMKKQIVLRELDSYSKDGKTYGAVVAEMFGNLAQCNFYSEDIVIVELQFNTHEYQGVVYQDIIARDVIKL